MNKKEVREKETITWVGIQVFIKFTNLNLKNIMTRHIIIISKLGL